MIDIFIQLLGMFFIIIDWFVFGQLVLSIVFLKLSAECYDFFREARLLEPQRLVFLALIVKFVQKRLIRSILVIIQYHLHAFIIIERVRRKFRPPTRASLNDHYVFFITDT